MFTDGSQGSEISSSFACYWEQLPLCPFITVSRGRMQRNEIGKCEYHEIRDSDGLKEVRTARLEERTLEKAFLEVEEVLMYEAGIAD
ncbi:hypothetical protein TNCT_144361 [Trichonephila clavata]|uniref:Uncharacterized protein n=1 Tax=Trichonephila clavata TaxID=2740835 RepID=A0A8X6KA89_TRICU|nr:hypothetical protein TNCT_144361 [Trichonephila clavata]